DRRLEPSSDPVVQPDEKQKADGDGGDEIAQPGHADHLRLTFSRRGRKFPFFSARTKEARYANSARAASTAPAQRCARSAGGSTGSPARRHQARNSMFPSPPLIGEWVSPMSSNPIDAANPSTDSSTSRWTAGSRTTPDLPTLSRPASNCGLTRATVSPPGASTALRGGKISFSEMNDTSMVAASGRWPSSMSG